MEQFIPEVLDALGKFITTILGLAALYVLPQAFQYVGAQVERAKEKLKADKHEAAAYALDYIAGVAVSAAEQLFDDGANEAKLDYAVDVVTGYLKTLGLPVDLAAVKAVIESKVKRQKEEAAAAEREAKALGVAGSDDDAEPFGTL